MKIAGFILFLAFLNFVQELGASPSILTKNALTRGELFTDVSQIDEYHGHRTFWVCIDPKSVDTKVKCDDLGKNELMGLMAELQITIGNAKKIHEYGLRHGILLNDCARIRKLIKYYFTSAREVCLRGDTVKVTTNLLTGKIHFDWIFDEVRSNLGGSCEFIGCEE